MTEEFFEVRLQNYSVVAQPHYLVILRKAALSYLVILREA
jgi:hypothetical protein